MGALHQLPSGTASSSAGASPSTGQRGRAAIVRFVSRKVRDSVLLTRKSLKGTRTVIVEDLTPRAYSLFSNVKADKEVCQQAWTKNGSVMMKAHNGSIVTIQSLSDLTHVDKRAQWAGKHK